MLEKAFPQGLENIETPRRQRYRIAYDEWCDAVDTNDELLNEIHNAWICLVLMEILDFDEHSLVNNRNLNDPYIIYSTEGLHNFSPDYVICRPIDGKPRLFISILSPQTDLQSIQQTDGWFTNYMERMTIACRTFGVRLGLVTNGEQWMVVNAPVDSTSSYASWYARLWFQEAITLKAFQSLLGVRRFFGPDDETLSSLLEESLKHSEEITDTLGEQVRRAVEVLIQCLDKADEDRNRELLQDVSPSELYEAGLTVMMRLVFILCAEERGLLLSGDSIYDQCYAISSLRSQLAEDADRNGPEVLERRFDAWSRMLSVFRAVYTGIEYESLRMPALGGSLFDPDQFPFLEGRQKGNGWLNTNAHPLPIDNRTVLLLLNSLQVLEHQNGALLLSYRALDVEQIGHVYEGLLEHTVERVPDVTLGLTGSKNAKNPNVSLSELEKARKESETALIAILRDITQRSEATLRKAVNKPNDEIVLGRLFSLCGGNLALAERIRPFLNLIRNDAWGDPIVYRANSFMVTLGADRRETGTHYTPKILTENIVSTTLEPLVFKGPENGLPREQWIIKSSSELLDLKICDLAMGSGAFLVQVCRYLAERLVEAWSIEEKNGSYVTIEGESCDSPDSFEPISEQLDERLLIARRLIAERCIYGVDVNPLAVELAKMSIWLITLAKGRPFGFLDHNLRNGDSLLGIHSLNQVISLTLNSDEGSDQHRFFELNIYRVIKDAIDTRQRLRNVPIRNINDIEYMYIMDQEVRNKLEVVELLADAMIGEVLRSGGNDRIVSDLLSSLSTYVGGLFDNNKEVIEYISKQSKLALSLGLPNHKPPRKPFHWPLEFPEVFQDNGGFDAIVGNPPFIGGRRIRGAIGDEMISWLQQSWPHSSMNADLSSFFYLRTSQILKENGEFGLLATKTIAQGDTARTGLSHMIEKQNIIIRNAISTFPWPGTASVVAALVIGHKGDWNGLKELDGNNVNIISAVLDDKKGWGEAQRLSSNIDRSSQGSVLRGMGFVLSEGEMMHFIERRQANDQAIFPFLSGDDLNSHPEQKASRYVIDFRDSTLQECEKKWPELVERIKLLVKPERDKLRSEADRRYWWRHWRNRSELYGRIKNREEVFVVAAVTKYIAIASVSSNQVFLNKIYVFDLNSWSNFATLQCTFHDLWARRGSSTNGETLNYTPSDYFDTYPFLHIENAELNEIGHRYHETRKLIMKTNDEGLTAAYNKFHNPDVSSQDINKLRELHVMMDEAVADAYGWKGLELKHDFYETKQGVRFTICEEAKREVLDRLLKLNNIKYKEEMSHLSEDKKAKKSNRKSKKV